MTDRYAVLGNPVGHSKSPRIHQAFAEATGQDIAYEALEAPLGDFAAVAEALQRQGVRGLNVTVPFKRDACVWATERRDAARLAGAANALSLEEGRVVAENFDGVGLVRDLVANLGRALRGRRVLLLGSGGSTRGALLPLLAEEPARLVVVARQAAEARALVAEVAPGRAEPMEYPELAGHGGFDVVLNATSASLQGLLPPVTAGSFASGCLAYDLLYGRGLTPFLRLAREAGAGQLADGVGMLVEQAAEAFAWWRGVRPPTGGVVRALAVPLT